MNNKQFSDANDQIMCLFWYSSLKVDDTNRNKYEIKVVLITTEGFSGWLVGSY